MLKYGLLVILNVFCANLFAQLDSINYVLEQMPDDSAKVKQLNNLCWEYRNSNPEMAVEFGSQAIEIGEKTGYIDEMLKALSFTGVAYRNLGNYPEAFRYFYSHLEQSKMHKNTEQMGYAYVNLGNAFIYQEKPNEAISMLSEALIISMNENNSKQSAYVMLNLGRAYLMNKMDSIALDFFHKAYEYRNEIDDIDGQGICMKYIGDVYFSLDEYDKALEYYLESMKMVRLDKDRDLFSDLLNNLSQVYLKQNNLSKALEKGLLSYKVGLESGTKLRIMNSCKTIASVYSKQNLYEKAFQYQDYYIAYKDSLFSEDVTNRIAAMKYEMERKEREAKQEIERQKNELKEKEQQAEIAYEKKKNIWLLSVIALIALLAIVLFRTNRQRLRTNRVLVLQKEQIELKNRDLQTAYTEIQQQNVEITAQKEEIEAQRDFVMRQGDKISNQKEQLKIQRDFVMKQKKEITDSIHYAQRIQQAILPQEEYIKKNLPDFFIFYKPRDIVSGDFYWVTEIHGLLIVAAADCTGHGVPGAFMSMLGIASMNEIVGKMETINAATILNHLRSNIIKSLHQTGRFGESKDGMDISLVVIDTNTLSLQYAGANNPLYLVRNSELIEYKADKMPIGIHVTIDTRPFINNIIKLEKNDLLYLSSDGYPDQFGGPKSRKFKYRPFKELLCEISSLPMIKQKDKLNKELKDWMQYPDPHSGEPHTQIDDIVIIGLKI